MSGTNVRDIWYHKHNGTHYNGNANVLCANPIVYRMFVKKVHAIGGSM